MDNTDKPWFNLNPNNFNDRWWLYSSIVNTQTDKLDKIDDNIICQLIIQDTNDVGYEFWRCSTWYKDDPNRYSQNIYGNDWKFNKSLRDMKEGEIVIKNNNRYKVYNCKFGSPDQIDFCKILERIEE